MSRGNELTINTVYQELQDKFDYTGKFTPIKIPKIHKLEQEDSKSSYQQHKPPSVIKLFDRNQENLLLFNKIIPALKLLYEIFPNQQNVAQIQTDLLELQTSGFYFIEYKHFGLSLEQFLEVQQHPFDVKSVLNYCLQIAKGLALLQFVGINHRDVKVSNVIIVNETTLKIIDFEISKTQRSTESVKKQTDNKLTKCYSSPEKLKRIKGQKDQSESNGYIEDAYSLALLMLEIIFNKTEMQNPINEFIKSSTEYRIKQKTYCKYLNNLMQEFKKHQIKAVFEDKAKAQLIKLCFILLCYHSEKRIDLLALYRCLRHIELNQSDKIQKLYKEQIELAKKRKYQKYELINEESKLGGLSCLSQQDKIKYILYPSLKDHGIKSVQRSSARVATLNQNRDKLIIFDFNRKSQSVDFTDWTSVGTRVVTTDSAAFIMGGQDENTGNTLTLNISCKYSDMSISRKQSIPDDGRSSFGVTFSFKYSIIPLVGGFMKNSKLAKIILTYIPFSDKWIQNASLLERRIQPSCCFSQNFLYVFGGMVESDGPEVMHTQKIERFKAESLGGSDRAKGKVINICQIPEFLKFVARTDALAFHLQEEEILLLGGVNDDEDDLKEAYRIDFKSRQVTEIKEPFRNAQTSFYSPGIIHKQQLYVADMHKEGAQLYIGAFDKDYKSIKFEVKSEGK